MDAETMTPQPVRKRSLRVARTEEQPSLRPEGSAAEPVWLVADVAAYLQVPVSSVYRMTGRAAGLRIPHIRLAGRLRFRRSDIDQWLTLLTVSNVDVLSRLRQKVRR
jgi:excisionase family DNA binding protein